MKKLLLFIAAISLLSACGKDDLKSEDQKDQSDGSLVVFTSSLIDTEVYWHYKLNGKDSGPVRYKQNAPDCNSTSLPVAKLAPGKHKLEFKAGKGTFPEKDITITIKAGQCLVFDFRKEVSFKPTN